MATYQKVSLPLFLERKPRSLPVFRVKQLRVFTKPATWNTPLSCSIIVSTRRVHQQVSHDTVHTQTKHRINKEMVKRVGVRRQTPSRSLCTWHIPCRGRSCALRGETAETLTDRSLLTTVCSAGAYASTHARTDSYSNHRRACRVEAWELWQAVLSFNQ